MDFFSGKNPDLIGPTMKTTLHEIMNKPKINNSTISERITNVICGLYNDYIYEYMFIVIVIIIIILCLVARYYSRKNNPEHFTNKNKKNNKKDLIEEIKKYNFDGELDDLPRATSPPAGHMNFDPIESINKQDNELIPVYPPDTLPVNIGDNKIFTRNLYENPIGEPPLNAPDYDYNNVYKNRSRSYYSGAYNTYNNAQDTSIENPYGWSNKFNTTTGKFVEQMTDKNLQSVIDYHAISDNMEANLIDGANGALMRQRFVPEFEKPYDE